MIVTEIVGNAHEDASLVAGRHVERVELPGDRLVQRVQRITTDHGRELGLRLPRGAADLRDGDVLFDDGHDAVVVTVPETDVLVVRARTIREMAFAAHSLGNRHLPAQFFDADGDFGADVMVVRYDHTVEEFLLTHGVPFTREEHLMPVPFRHTEHTH